MKAQARLTWLGALLAAVCLLSLSPPVSGQALLADQELVDTLRRGGYVIYFRHAATDFSQTDTDPGNPENCRAQRNLSEEGREQARAIGRAFAALRIPVGRVLSGRYCRTMETARLAFGEATPTWDLTGLPQAPTQAERERRIAALRALLGTRPQAGTNTILVSHLFNIQAANLSIAEGEAAIFDPAGSGFRPAARVVPERWTVLAQRFGR